MFLVKFYMSSANAFNFDKAIDFLMILSPSKGLDNYAMWNAFKMDKRKILVTGKASYNDKISLAEWLPKTI